MADDDGHPDMPEMGDSPLDEAHHIVRNLKKAVLMAASGAREAGPGAWASGRCVMHIADMVIDTCSRKRGAAHGKSSWP